MTKTIDTLISDIYTLLGNPNADLVFDMAHIEGLGLRMAQPVKDEIKDPDRTNRDASEVYVTNLTSNCPRRRWYERNAARFGIPREKVTGQNRFKFVYGDLIEEAVLFMADIAGHKVELRQERLGMLMQRGSESYTVVGRIDAVIDGVLVDVKCMESFTFDRFAKGEYDDKWGYGNQLLSYDTMMRNDKKYSPPADRCILGINKLNGRMHLAHLPASEGFSLKAALADAVATDKNKVMADRHTKTYGGVTALDTLCAYCPFKVDCYQDQGGLTVYAYAEGPKFVVGLPAKTPKVPEITKAWLKETHG